MVAFDIDTSSIANISSCWCILCVTVCETEVAAWCIESGEVGS